MSTSSGRNGTPVDSNPFAALATLDQEDEETSVKRSEAADEMRDLSEDQEVSFKTPSIEDTIESAMKHISQSTDAGTRHLVKSVVAAVVAAFMPVMTSMQATIAELKAPKAKPQIPDVPPQIPEAATKAIRKNHYKWDDVEQYSRRDNIIIRGVPETSGKSTNDIVMDLAFKAGVNVTPQDISTSHRLKQRRASQPSSIVVKFTRRDVRNEIMRKKKNLRNQPDCGSIFFDEHLTSLRHKILMAVKHDDEVEKAWTIDGKIICLMTGGTNRKLTISSPDDLQHKLGWSEEKVKAELSLDF